jgi:hypothetical protein
MTKKYIYLFLLLFPLQLLAQNNVITGNVFDNENRKISLEGTSVKNLSNKLFVLSNKDGHFAISAKVGDLITFNRVGYQPDTIYLENLFPKNVYLVPDINNLKTVDITSTKISPYLNTKDPNATPSRPVDYSKQRGGMRLNLGYGKFKKDAAKIKALEENERYQEEISKNFTEEYIINLVKFEGPGIRDFMDLFRPTVAQVKAQQPFNYAYHTAKAYRAWLQLPVDQRKLPPLVKKKVN